MEKQICLPDRTKRLYTESDYRDALYIAGGDEKLALLMEENRGCGFGFMYIKLVYEALENPKDYIRKNTMRRINDLAMNADPAIVRDLVNDEFSLVRQIVSVTLNRYANRRGMIDVWPQPDVEAGVTLHGWENGKSTGDFKIRFGFFKPDFTLVKQGNVYWPDVGKRLKLHRFYSAMPEPQEVKAAKARASQLRMIKKPTQKQRVTGIVKTVASFFPIALALLCAIALLIWALNGTKTNESMGDLAAMYDFMTSSLFVFVSMLSGIIVSGLIATGLARLFLDPQLISAEEVRKGEEAQRELEQIENDPQIRKSLQDYNRRRTLEIEQVNAWQEEWFDVCQLMNMKKS